MRADRPMVLELLEVLYEHAAARAMFPLAGFHFGEFCRPNGDGRAKPTLPRRRAGDGQPLAGGVSSGPSGFLVDALLVDNRLRVVDVHVDVLAQRGWGQGTGSLGP